MADSLSKVCRLINAVGVFEGTTKLHKVAYVAQVLGYPILEHFEWYTHGPYSPSLALKLNQLIAAGLVKRTQTKTGKYTTHRYALTAAGREFMDLVGGGTEFDDRLKKLVTELHQKRRGRDMELIDSILYWEGQGLTRQEAVDTVVSIKPKFAGRRAEIEQALEDMRVLEEHYSASNGDRSPAGAS